MVCGLKSDVCGLRSYDLSLRSPSSYLYPILAVVHIELLVTMDDVGTALYHILPHACK